MTLAAAPGVNATNIDFRKSLFETLVIDDGANQLLRSHTEGSARRGAPSSGDSRRIADVATHIRGVGLLGFSVADKTAKLPAKLNHEQAKRSEVQASLKGSPEAIVTFVEKALENREGRALHCNPMPSRSPVTRSLTIRSNADRWPWWRARGANAACGK